MSNKHIDPRQQFSKKLAGRTEWFWFFYLVLLVALIAYQPDVAMIAVYLGIIVTFVMFVSVLAYTKNSTFEKGLYAAQELAKIKFSFKRNGVSISADPSEKDESDNDDIDDTDDVIDEPDDDEIIEGGEG